MNSFEINKVISAIILVVLAIVGINKLADVIYDVKVPEGNTYKLASETKEISKEDDTKVESDFSIKAFLALGNFDQGKVVFKKCVACHSISKDGGNKIGPALWGVLGRKVGSVPDYKYSKAMAAYGKSWSFEEMNGFLIKPKDWIKGTKMSFAGLKNEKERAAVILFMNENTNNPLPLN